MPKAKTATAKKAPAKKTTRTTVNTNAFKASATLQYGDKSVAYDDLVARLKDVWTNQLGKKIIDINTVDLYIKPEENKVYYVVNNTDHGDFDL